MSGRTRGELLYKLADLIDKNAEELAGLIVLDNGKPVAEAAYGEIPVTSATVRYYAGWADKLTGETVPVDNKFGNYFCYTRREPVGVCGQIIPWNFPMLMVAQKWAPALAAGNTLVLKPAEQTPLSALRLGELAMEAGFPPGVINIVNGLGEIAGDALVKHPGVDKIAFTGGSETGRSIMAGAAATLKRCTLELGGKSPNVVFADADMKSAVYGAISGIFFNQGEVCTSGSRLFVEKSIHDEFVEQLVKVAEKRTVGDPFDPKIKQGAQVSQEHFDRILKYIDIGKNEDKATCVAGGERAGDTGYFIRPTVFTGVNNQMRIAREEIFGPVLSVIAFEDMDQLITDANDTSYGLAAAVWTADITKAFAMADRLRAGTVWINCVGAFDAAAPFGGFKASGIGRELGRQGVEAYTELKTVWVNLGKR